MAKLFIVGFPKDMSEIGLLELFSIHGAVNTVTIITDLQTGESKGYGFVTMNDDAGATRAIAALNGETLGTRTISVRFAEEKSKPDQVSFLDRDAQMNRQPFNLTKNEGQERPKRPRSSR
ncbi:RNA-binding protein [Mucilaginibacter galii]|uniref:RRM domain-containing protein n=1 Tax=Mucilaginibacter galii TaxID=2005073 RepID=A0A917J7D9_9SPHI|nr:RNA-binding protein [Mucilaginibacter galii]GGI48791.1 hypothetical protein GCM10011425_00030 [Mucilaginibacter galii]